MKRLAKKYVSGFRLCLCLIGDDRFINGALVMLYSLLKNDPIFKDIDVVCFYDDRISKLSKKNKELLKEVAPKIKFHEVNVDLYRNYLAKYSSHNISLLKFECFKLINYDYVFYIDTDILILKPISHLIKYFDVFRHADVLGVENTSRSWDYKVYKFSCFSINTGLLLFKLRSSTIAPLLIYNKLLKEIEGNLRVDDLREMICQPIFNKVLSESNLNFISAPVGYNFRSLDEFEVFIDSVSIIHFVTRSLNKEKPWDKMCVSKQYPYHLWRCYYSEICTKFLQIYNNKENYDSRN